MASAPFLNSELHGHLPAMDSSSNSASSANISLTAASPSNSGIAFPERHMSLNPTNDSVMIGRASKTFSKGFLASKDNAWFDSAVMSRKHAEIMADFKNKKVKIQDLGSLHGTFINDEDEKLPTHEPRELQDGDSVRFGVAVWRATENFAPATVKVGIAFDHRKRASSTFRVPEDSDNESDIECYSNNGDFDADDAEPVIIMEGKRVSETIDLTGQRPVSLIEDTEVRKGNCVNDVIDLSSPPQSPAVIEDEDGSDSDSDSVLEIRGIPTSVAKASAVAEDDVDDYGSDKASWDGEIEDDFSEDEQLSVDYGSVEGSDVAFTDSDAESDELDADSVVSDEAAPHGLDDEQSSVFDGSEHEIDELDESEDEEEDIDRCIGEFDSSDEDAPMDSFWQPPDDHPILKQAMELASFLDTPMKMTPDTPMKTTPDTPMKTTPDTQMKTALPVTIVNLLNSDETQSQQPFTRNIDSPGFDNQVTVPKSQRPPSPSDFIMSKSFNKPTDAPEASSGAQLLALKSGKHEYFEAREDNKTSLHKKAVSSVHSLCNVDVPAGVPFCTSETNLPGDRPFRLPHLHHMSSHFGPLEFLATEATAASTSVQVPKEFAQEPAPESANITANNEKTMTTLLAPANGSDVSRHTGLRISDIVDSCQKTPDEGRGKRKAKDISALSEEEEEWVARDKPALAKTAVPISPTPSPVSELMPAREVSLIPMDIDKAEMEPPVPPKADAATVVPVPEVRAPKRRRLQKIAERVGYAALGGVTAGAMIVGTLIYTAPTF